MAIDRSENAMNKIIYQAEQRKYITD